MLMPFAFLVLPVADLSADVEVVSVSRIKHSQRVVEEPNWPKGVKVIVQQGKDGVLTNFVKHTKVSYGTLKNKYSKITILPTEEVVRVGTNDKVILGVSTKIKKQQKPQYRFDSVSTVAPTGFTTPAENRAYAKKILSADEFADFDWIIQRESNWRTNAKNPYSGAYGVAQSLPASKYASAGSDWLTNGKTQVDWGIKYMRSRYGSIAKAKAFWKEHHWY